MCVLVGVCVCVCVGRGRGVSRWMGVGLIRSRLDWNLGLMHALDHSLIRVGRKTL